MEEKTQQNPQQPDQQQSEQQAVPQTGPAPGGLEEGPEARGRVAELEAALGQAREALDHAERRHAIDLELIRAGVVDMDVARLMTELAVAGMGKADVAHAVSDLRRRKPFLFRRATSPGVMAPLAEAGSGERELLAREAEETGDRRTLLRYLRARRAS